MNGDSDRLKQEFFSEIRSVESRLRLEFSAKPAVNIPVDPLTNLTLETHVAIPYTTTQPTFTPQFNGVRRIYNDGADHWFYVYTNGSWRYARLAGGGTVVYLLPPLTPDNAILPNTNFAQPGRVIGTNFSYNTLDYDQTTSEAAYWVVPIPAGITVSSGTIDIFWTAASGTGTVTWDADHRTVDDDQVIDAATTPTTRNDTVTDTLLATGDLHRASIALTATDLGAGKVILMKISRDVSDSLNADARFKRAIIKLS